MSLGVEEIRNRSGGAVLSLNSSLLWVVTLRDWPNDGSWSMYRSVLVCRYGLGDDNVSRKCLLWTSPSGKSIYSVKVIGQLFLESQVTSDNFVSFSDRSIDALKNNLPCQLATKKMARLWDTWTETLDSTLTARNRVHGRHFTPTWMFSYF